MKADTIQKRDRDRLQTLKIFIIVSILQVPFFAPAYWFAGSKTASLAILTAVPAILATAWFAKKFKNPVIAGNWIIATGFILFAFNAAHTGGLTAPPLTWSIAAPLVATLICGRRSGIFWFLMVAAKMSWFYFRERGGHPFIQEYGPEGYRFAFYVTIVGITLFLLILALTSEYFRKRYQTDLEKTNHELRAALESIKLLKEMIPICAWCKKTRNDKGYWSSLEVFLEKHSDMQFSHGICPECEAQQRQGWKKPS